jgi:hypothetical protein
MMGPVWVREPALSSHGVSVMAATTRVRLLQLQHCAADVLEAGYLASRLWASR